MAKERVGGTTYWPARTLIRFRAPPHELGFTEWTSVSERNSLVSTLDSEQLPHGQKDEAIHKLRFLSNSAFLSMPIAHRISVWMLNFVCPTVVPFAGFHSAVIRNESSHVKCFMQLSYIRNESSFVRTEAEGGLCFHSFSSLSFLFFAIFDVIWMFLGFWDWTFLPFVSFVLWQWRTIEACTNNFLLENWDFALFAFEWKLFRTAAENDCHQQ